LIAVDGDGVETRSMTGERWFFDTNVLVYLFDAKAPTKGHLEK